MTWGWRPTDRSRAPPLAHVAWIQSATIDRDCHRPDRRVARDLDRQLLRRVRQCRIQTDDRARVGIRDSETLRFTGPAGPRRLARRTGDPLEPMRRTLRPSDHRAVRPERRLHHPWRTLKRPRRLVSDERV